MKKIRIPFAVLLLLLTAFAWTNQIGKLRSHEKNFTALCEKAQAYAENKLYQKAAETYESALLIKESSEIRAAQIRAYRDGYETGTVSRKLYENALETAVSKAPKQSAYWEELITLQAENGAYSDAHKTCGKAARAGAKSDTLTALTEQVNYSYKIGNKSYTAALLSTDGYFTLSDGECWGVLDPSGDDFAYDCVYRYISPVGADGTVYFETVGDWENDVASSAAIVDKSGRVQAYITFPENSCRAASECFIPVKENDAWHYYDYENGAFADGTYDEASAVTDSVAAVKQGAVWHLKNMTDGTEADTAFTDVKLFETGEYVYDGKLLAAESTVYGLYTQKGKKTAEIPGTAVDIYRGEAIAFRAESGLWGFADEKGKVIIEPQYENAKSFSGHMAAVCMDGRWGFVNADGKLVIDYQYADAGYFNQNGVCFVSVTEGSYFPITLRFPQK